MLPKNGHLVEKNYFLYSIIKIYDVNYYLKHRKNIFCNFTIFELVNEIGDFESLCYIDPTSNPGPKQHRFSVNNYKSSISDKLQTFKTIFGISCKFLAKNFT